tara:strand:+ start:34665 stop:35402 length:738 start_codon:yes stop_codon:yes gene_type:complete
MELLIFLVFLILVIVVFFKIKPKGRLPGYVYGVDQPSFLSEKSPTPVELYPYITKGPLFSAAERSFYGVLAMAAGDTAIVFGKVRIADILEPEAGLNKSNWQTSFNKISRKHFDYVLCEPTDLSIICVVELDDKSHNSNKQKERDLFVEGACNKSGLTLHRFKASDNYSVANIRNKIFLNTAFDDTKMQAAPTEAALTKETEIAAEKTCPQCSSNLVTRTATKGSNKGNNFIACSAYPKCRHIEP